jgi:hypothetical protein
MSRPLTQHQREVFGRIQRLTRRNPTAESNIGSRGAVEKLIDKGYVEVVRVEYGPRGGERRFIQAVYR